LRALGPTAMHNGPLQNECVNLILKNLRDSENGEAFLEAQRWTPPQLVALATLVS
jgi:hypothetical protein